MTDKDLDNLLRTDDASLPLPAMPSDLADRVRARAARRKTAGRAIVAASISAVVVAAFCLPRAGSVSQIARQDHSTVNPKTSIAAHAESDQLAIDASRQEAFLERLLQLEANASRTQASRSARPVGLSESPTINRLAAVAVLVARADMLQENVEMRAEAAKGYKRVIELFPDTPQSRVAEQRLRDGNI